MEQHYFSSIIQNLRWKEVGNKRTIILLDDGFAEISKWRNDSVTDFPILSLSNDERTLRILSMHQAERIAIFTSFPLDEIENVIVAIRNTSLSSEICILTTSSSDFMSSLDTDNFKVQQFLASSKISLVHLPSHALNLLSLSERQKIGLFVLSSPFCRGVFPLTMSSVREDSSRSSSPRSAPLPSSLQDLAAEDISPKRRKALKTLAHELAGALVYDLGVDPTGFVFASGKTASLVGHTVQTALSPLVQQWSENSSVTECSGKALLLRSSRACDVSPLASTGGKLATASLILIDRTVDLYTPSCHDASGPIAHRILSTIKRQKSQHPDVKKQPAMSSVVGSCPSLLDISLPQLTSRFPIHGHLISNTTNAVTPIRQCDVMNRPLSAVSSLPCSTDPSIAPLPKSSPDMSGTFLRAMLSYSEERGKTELYDALRQRVIEEGGVIPPAKKRGVGAEVLGLVNALAAASSGTDEGDAVVAESVLLRSQSLMAWATAVIDAMQRSSAKQLQAHLQAQGVRHPASNSFETRSLREKQLLQSVWQQGQLDLLSVSVLVDIILDLTGLRASSDEFGEMGQSDKVPSFEKESADLQHVLLLVIGTLSLIDCSRSASATAEYVTGALASLARALARYIVDLSSNEEMDIIAPRISTEIRTDILALRQLFSTSGPSDDEGTALRSRLLLEVEDTLGGWLETVSEVAAMRRQALVRKTSGGSALSHVSVKAEEDCIFNMVQGLKVSTGSGNGVDNSVKKHKVVKSSSLENKSTVEYPAGIVASLVRAVLNERKRSLYGYSPLQPIGPISHIENPLLSFARAGLGILSQGLGRFGLGGAAVAEDPHPSSNRIIVVFIVGGVSLLEVERVQEVLELACREDEDLDGKCQIVIGANDIVNPLDLLEQLSIM